MNAGRPPGRAPRAARRFRRWLLALVALPCAAWLTRAQIAHPLLVAGALRLAPRYGFRLELEEISSNWWNSLRLNKFSLVALDEGTQLRRVEFRELNAQIDPRILGGDIWRYLQRVEAEDLLVELDLRHQAKAQASAPGFALELPPALPEVVLQQAQLRLLLPEAQELLLRGIQFTSFASGEAGQASRLEWQAADLVLPAAWSGETFALSGSASLDRQELRIESLLAVNAEHELRLQAVVLPMAWPSNSELVRALRGGVALRSSALPLQLLIPGETRKLPALLELSANCSAGRLSIARGRLELPGAALSDWRGSLALLSSASHEFAAELNLHDAKTLSATFGGPICAGNLGGDIHVLGSWEAPRIAFELDGQALQYGEHDLGELALKAQLEPRRVEVESLRWDGPYGKIDGSLLLPTLGFATGVERDAPFELHLRTLSAAQSVLDKALPGQALVLGESFVLRLDLGGSLALPRGELELEHAQAHWQETELAALGVLALQARVAVGDAIVLEHASLSSERGLRLEASGELRAPLDLSRLVRAELGGLLHAPLDLNLSAQCEDLAWLSVQFPQLRRSAGRLSAEMQVAGTAHAPTFAGKLQLAEGSLRLASDFPAIEQISAELAFLGTKVAVRELCAELGAAPVALRGTLDLGQQPPILDLTLQGTNVLLARDDQARVRADLDLRLQGKAAAPQVAGKVAFANTTVRSTVDFLGLLQPRGPSPASLGGIQLFSLRDPPLSAMTFDVELGAVEPIELESNVASGKLLPALRLAGSGEMPTPEGRIFLDDFELKLPGGRFRFDGGQIEFSRADPFHPRLQLTGQARLAGHDVTLLVDGPLAEPQIELQSSPPLARDRLFLLVVSGTLPPEDWQASSRAATRSVTLYVAKDLVTRWLSGSGDDSQDSFLDRLEIVTGSEVSKAGVLSTEARLRLRENVFGEDEVLYLTAERDVYEDYNMGLRLVFRFP